jgi:hypothetical protein
LVERNLAKVEVASSSLVSRSSSAEKGKLRLPFFVAEFRRRDGAIAKRLCNGLQIRLARFDSGSRLQFPGLDATLQAPAVQPAAEMQRPPLLASLAAAGGVTPAAASDRK